MFIFFFIFLIVNLIVSIGYEDVFNLNTDRKLHLYNFGTAIGYFIVFLTVTSIMEKLIFWGFIYEIVGLILFTLKCRKYQKDKDKEMENF
jgi:hypothetical protein